MFKLIKKVLFIMLIFMQLLNFFVILNRFFVLEIDFLRKSNYTERISSAAFMYIRRMTDNIICIMLQ